MMEKGKELECTRRTGGGKGEPGVPPNEPKNVSGISTFSKAVKIEHFNVYNRNLIWKYVKPDNVLKFISRECSYRLFGSWSKFIESG
jgi:hypothetical protein